MRLSHLVFFLGLVCTLSLFIPFSLTILYYLPGSQEAIIEEHAKILSDYLGDQLVPLLLVDDYLHINELLLKSIKNVDVDFLFILSPKGNPLASTFNKGVPDALIKLVRASPENVLVDVTINDIPYKVGKKLLLNGELGQLYFGTAILEIQQNTKWNFSLLVAFLVIVLAFTIAGSYAIGRLVGGPLERLASATGSIPYKDTKITQEKKLITSEVQALFTAFKSMIKRIREADREREEFNKRMAASERLVAVGSLASGVAHEINNPLNGIEACLKRMEKCYSNPEKLKEYISSSIRSLNHMKNVVRGMLDFSRPEKYSFEKLNVNDLCKEAIGLTEFRLQKQNLILKKDFSQHLPDITGDRQHLHQLLVNMILNSSDAMPNGGTLIITTETDGINAILKIEDTGEGIPSSLLDKVFDPFFTTKEPGKGTGLGLAVSNRIVKEHKGKIEILSKRGVGTKIAVIIPLYDEKDRKNEHSIT